MAKEAENNNMNIHPFPARMAPDLVDQSILSLNEGSKILDPMCGSGTTLRRSLEAGHLAHGWDIDPLAVKMSRVRCRRYDVAKLSEALELVMGHCRSMRDLDLLFADCDETMKFASYWFADQQKLELNALSLAIDDCYPAGRYRDFFHIALSRIIITKFKGASLAWDISHSRPHKKKSENEFDVIEGFEKSARKLLLHVKNNPCPRDAKISLQDCRKPRGNGTYDAIITSPPYLNAIDYMRGHKFSLIWMGYSIPELRKIRSSAIGSESQRKALADDNRLQRIAAEVCHGRKVNQRTNRILIKYIDDCDQLMTALKTQLKPGGSLVFVLANSIQYGTKIRNDEIVKILATEKGFQLSDEKKRMIPQNARYLPTKGKNQITKRMKSESVIKLRM